MQVSVESTAGLERKLTVEIPAEKIENEINERLAKLRKQAHLKGFRPGKVPESVLRRQFGNSIRYEVVEDTMRKTLQEALDQEQLKPAGAPTIEAKQIEPGKPLSYVATFEIYPLFDIKDLEGASVTKEMTSLTEKEIEETLEKVRKQHAQWVEVDREAKSGDQVVIDFDGKLNGVAIEKGSAKDFVLTIGSKQMIDGFEESFIGKKPVIEFDVDLKFPEKYPDQRYAGQLTTFTMKLLRVLEANLPIVDSDFAKKMGIEDGDVAKLTEEIKQTLQQELDNHLKLHLKDEVFKQFVALNPVEVPKSLIDQEIESLKHMMVQNSRGQLKLESLTREPFEKEAVGRVHLSMLINEFVKKNEMKVDEAKVRAEIHKVVSVYEDPERMAAMFYNNKDMMAQMRMGVLEQQVVDKLLEKATIIETTVDYNSIMHHEHQHSHAYGSHHDDHDHHDHDHDHHDHDHDHLHHEHAEEHR